MKTCNQCNSISKYSICKRCRNKNYYEKNKEEILAKNRIYGKVWRQTDRYRAYLDEYKSLNKESLNEYKRLFNSGRRSKLRQGKVTVEEWEEIISSQNYLCIYCKIGNVKLTIDHIVPLSKGGLHSKENVCGACLRCNLSKRDKYLKDWIKEIQ